MLAVRCRSTMTVSAGCVKLVTADGIESAEDLIDDLDQALTQALAHAA